MKRDHKMPKKTESEKLTAYVKIKAADKERIKKRKQHTGQFEHEIISEALDALERSGK